MLFSTYYNSKSVNLVNSIIASEDLSITWTKVVNALGDTVIEAKGDKEDIKTLREVYAMVS